MAKIIKKPKPFLTGAFKKYPFSEEEIMKNFQFLDKRRVFFFEDVRIITEEFTGVEYVHTRYGMAFDSDDIQWKEWKIKKVKKKEI